MNREAKEKTYCCHVSGKRIVRLSPDTVFEERILVANCVRVGIAHPFEVLARHRIDNLFPDLLANLAVSIEDLVIC